jgi:hypothetical protein
VVVSLMSAPWCRARRERRDVLTATAAASAASCPATARARPGPASSELPIVPRSQSPPAITAPSTTNGTVVDGSSASATITNWLGSKDSRIWAGLHCCTYSAGVSVRYTTKLIM